MQGKSSLHLSPFAQFHIETKYETHGKLQPLGGRGTKTFTPKEQSGMSHTPGTPISQHFSPIGTSTRGFGCWPQWLGPGVQLPGEPLLLTSSPLNKDFPLPKTAALAKDSLEAALKLRVSRAPRHLLQLHLPLPKPGRPTAQAGMAARTDRLGFRHGHWAWLLSG